MLPGPLVIPQQEVGTGRRVDLIVSPHDQQNSNNNAIRGKRETAEGQACTPPEVRSAGTCFMQPFFAFAHLFFPLLQRIIPLPMRHGPRSTLPFSPPPPSNRTTPPNPPRLAHARNSMLFLQLILT